jgi:F-type H+-transporting ATPase subunit delta
MKASREARAAAKRLFQSCRVHGVLDESRLRAAVRALVQARHRHSLAILSQLERLTALDIAARTAVVETPFPLGPAEPEVAAALRRRFGPDLIIRTETKPELLGGLRLRVGSDVWDGTVRGRLDTLAASF